MLIYHFVDPGLRVETFFEKDEAGENGGVDFKIGDRGTSEGWRKFNAEPVCFLVFWWQKK